MPQDPDRKQRIARLTQEQRENADVRWRQLISEGMDPDEATDKVLRQIERFQRPTIGGGQIPRAQIAPLETLRREAVREGLTEEQKWVARQRIQTFPGGIARAADLPLYGLEKLNRLVGEALGGPSPLASAVALAPTPLRSVGQVAKAAGEAAESRRIRREVAEEEVAPTVAPANRFISDIAKFVTEFETGRRIVPGLSPVAPTARTAVGRVAKGVAADIGQFGAFETGMGVLEGENVDEIAARQRTAAIAAGLLGSVFRGAGEAIATRGRRSLQEALLAEREAPQPVEVPVERPPAPPVRPRGDLEVFTESLTRMSDDQIRNLRATTDTRIRNIEQGEMGIEARELAAGERRDLAQNYRAREAIDAEIASRPAVVEVPSPPKTMYHGTGTTFELFELSKADPRALYGPGFYFTDSPAIASGYAKGTAPNVRPVTLDIRRPFDMESMATGDILDRLIGAAKRQKLTEPYPGTRIDVLGYLTALKRTPRTPSLNATVYLNIAARTHGPGSVEGHKVARKVLEDAGFDGIRYEGGQVLGGPKHDVWVAFKSEQIKSLYEAPDKTFGATVLAGERGAIQYGPDILEQRVDPKLPVHSRRIQDQISVGDREVHLPRLSSIYRFITRRTWGVKQAEEVLAGGAVPAEQSAAAAANLASGSARRTQAFLEIGPARWTARGDIELTGTPSMAETLAPLRSRLNEFRRYELSARTLEVAGRKIETPISPADARIEVENAAPVVIEAHRNAVKYRDDTLQYWVDAGGGSPEALRGLRELGKEYVSLRRVFKGRDLSAGVGRVGRIARPLKKLLGSRRHQLMDPIESTVEQTGRLVRAADLNRISLRLVELAERFPENAAGLMERITTKPRRLSTEARNLQRAAEARQIEMSDEVAAEIAGTLSDNALNVADDVIRVWRNGELQNWRVSPELAKSIKALHPNELPWFVRLLGVPAQGLKAGVTLNPAFQFFNFIRDTFDAAIQSQYGFKLGLDSFRGFYESAKGAWLRAPSEAYKKFALGGGGFSTFRGAPRQTVRAQMRRIAPQTLATRSLQKVMHPLAALKAFGTPFEEAARVGEFLRSQKARDSVIRGILAQQDVTVNFQQVGSGMQGLAHMTAFLNPAIQSLDRLLKVAARPAFRVKTEGLAAGAREAARVYGTAIGAITIPSIYFWAAARDDQEIKDLRKTSGGLIYWYLRSPDGTIVKVPKPFLWGQLFGTGMESALDKAFDDDPEAAARFVEGVREQAFTNALPNVLQIGLEQAANRDMFFKTPIVPPALEGLSPELQATERTSTIARKLGEAFNVSPARFEAVWRDLTGTLGDQMLRLSSRAVDRMAGTEDLRLPPVPSDNFLFGRFFARSPSTAVEPIRRFYDDLRKVTRVANDIRYYEKNEPDKVDLEIDEHEWEFVLLPLYEGVRQELSDLRHDIDYFSKLRAEEMSAIEKKRIVDELIREMVEIAREVNTIADEERQILARQRVSGGR